MDLPDHGAEDDLRVSTGLQEEARTEQCVGLSSQKQDINECGSFIGPPGKASCSYTLTGDRDRHLPDVEAENAEKRS